MSGVQTLAANLESDSRCQEFIGLADDSQVQILLYAPRTRSEAAPCHTPQEKRIRTFLGLEARIGWP